MPVPLAQGALYALVPAAVGAGVALALVARSRKDAPPGAGSSVAVLFAVPASAFLLALIAVLVAQPGDATRLRAPLLGVGAAAFVQATAQGLVGARAVRDVAGGDPARLGRALVALALPEVLTVAALLWVFVTLGA
jgi:F0F1-type ATP synthase membrane subunit c/vacuolar-type H+-ATPase subunit K